MRVRVADQRDLSCTVWTAASVSRSTLYKVKHLVVWKYMTSAINYQLYASGVRWQIHIICSLSLPASSFLVGFLALFGEKYQESHQANSCSKPHIDNPTTSSFSLLCCAHSLGPPIMVLIGGRPSSPLPRTIVSNASLAFSNGYLEKKQNRTGSRDDSDIIERRDKEFPPSQHLPMSNEWFEVYLAARDKIDREVVHAGTVAERSLYFKFPGQGQGRVENNQYICPVYIYVQHSLCQSSSDRDRHGIVAHANLIDIDTSVESV
jgi:hypothetical protein